MFTRKDSILFIISVAFVAAGYVLMALDPQPNGFGLLTLWLAPPMLLVGFALPCLGILGSLTFRNSQVHFQTAKHAAGLAVWAIALVTYGFTLEPTASLWDCSEFIASAYKLQVPHTPGTPLALLIGRMFAMMASGPNAVALMLNFSSAFFSALSSYLLFHIIYHFAVLLTRAGSYGQRGPIASAAKHSDGHAGTKEYISSILAAALGSLVLVFSDTFWFSAVEAETYGIACFFLLALVMLILRGKSLQGEQRMRRLVLIAYLSGISYCIHPMCVLALAVLPYYWFHNESNVLAIRPIVLLFAGIILVFLINRLVAIGIFEFAFAADKFFVNDLGLPFYSGPIFLTLFLVVAFASLIRKYPKWQVASWATIFLILGFAPYIMLFIRSSHNPPIDETNPENLPMIKAYMNRESYPSSPLLYGPYFDAQVEDVAAGRRIFHQAEFQYEFSGTLPEYRFEKKRSTILPRIYSNDPDHVEAYRQWLALKPSQRPNFSDNLNFLFTYQLGHMYMRYLMFNFAGRETDRQGGDWLRPWDDASSGATIYTSKARNQYWMLPLLAGVAGAIFQWRKHRQGFIAVLSLFLITGLVLALYLNSPPVEPRERDYIYVASFIAYCVWIGLSVAALASAMSGRALAIPLMALVTIGLPLLMFVRNYDDHNRSGRTFQVDNARNLLASCAPNAILFTGGDNDTFPLWYVQEVEGFRTDVRIMVLSYLNTDWYINQLRNQYYQSAPFALTLDRNDYLQYGANDVLYIQESIKEGINAQKYLQLIHDGNKALKAQSQTGDYFTILPSRKLLIQRGNAESGAQPKLTGLNKSENSVLSPYLSLDVKGNYATKSVLAIIDIMVSNHWSRPIYFNFTSLNTAGLNLQEHVVQEGAVYRFDRFREQGKGVAIDRHTMLTNLMKKANYSNLLNPDINFNYEDFSLRMISPLRQSFNALAISFLEAQDHENALSVMNFAFARLYLPHLLPTYANLEAAEIFNALGDSETARSLCLRLFNCHMAEIRWHLENDRGIDSLDRFLAQQSARMLAELGNSGPEAEFLQLSARFPR